MVEKTKKENGPKSGPNFIHSIIEEDIKNGVNGGAVVTRFPPEPNGYLHIGHAKSIVLNFGTAEKYNGKCNLRFDDTNPVAEDVEYVDSIKEDIKWLGYSWEGCEHYASDYFQQLYDWAVQMIKNDKAFVCDMSGEDMSASRGTPAVPGKESPYRNRSVEENLDLFERMKNGEFKNGEKVLRAKIGMTSPNMHMRDPVMYRILHTEHHRTGNKWCIYPTYDFTHGQSDYIEGITHSICTLEFEVHRPLYEWYLEQVYEEGKTKPKQREFSRLEMNYTVTSKRKLKQLVEENHVLGWDDPRMPTISGMRRRGYTADALKNFCEKIGVTKTKGISDIALLEHSVREDLNKKANRVMAVLDPLKVVITNYPDDLVEDMPATNNPEDESAGKRTIPFSKELYIERSDFMEDAPRKFFRLAPGREVRLRYGFFIKCEDVVKDADGNVIELKCTYDPESRGGNSPDGRKVKGTIHWVSAKHAKKAEIRLYDRLFMEAIPDDKKSEKEFTENLNPESLKVTEALVEPSLLNVEPLVGVQFERTGYFCIDPDSSKEKLIFNRTVTMRDKWSKKK